MTNFSKCSAEHISCPALHVVVYMAKWLELGILPQVGPQLNGTSVPIWEVVN